MKNILFVIAAASILYSCSNDTDKKADEDDQVSNNSIEAQELEATIPVIDTVWNYYSGTVGPYDSHIIMELSIVDFEIYGSYWYAKHKNRIRLTGFFNEKDQKYGLAEWYNGEVTGNISFTIDDGKIVGKRHSLESTGEEENFNCERVVSDTNERLNPEFKEYKMDHAIDVYNSEIHDFVPEQASDHCMISKISDDKFLFHYDVIGNSNIIGSAEGIGTYLSSTTGQFIGDGDCILKFTFRDNEIDIEQKGSCNSYNGHYANFDGTLTKVK